MGIEYFSICFTVHVVRYLSSIYMYLPIFRVECRVYCTCVYLYFLIFKIYLCILNESIFIRWILIGQKFEFNKASPETTFHDYFRKTASCPETDRIFDLSC